MLELAIQVLIVIILVSYAVLLYRYQYKKRFISWAVFTIFASGTVLYYMAFSMEPAVEGPVTILIRSMLDSIKLFVFDQELIEITRAQKEPLFLDAFHLVYAAAMMTTVYTVINIFAKRMKSNFVLMARPENVYRHVFFGIDPNSAHLASLIDDGRVAFIEFPDPYDEEKASFGHMLKGLTRKSVKKDGIESDNVDVLRASSRLSDVVPGGDVLKEIGLARLLGHIDSRTSFYLLSDDVQSNAICIRVLESDPYFKDKTIHVNQKQDGLTQQIELLMSPSGAHFIYPSTLAANLLARDASSHPVSVMDIPRDRKKRACGYASGMEALVVGFGRIGQAVTKFLYEYMAVPGKDGNEAPGRIYLQDAAMDEVKGSFINSTPGAAHGRKLIYEQVRAGSGAFWNKLEERMDKLSYIVLSLPDDELNLRIAGDILAFASARRKNGLEKFKVYVLDRGGDSDRVELVDFFNKRYGGSNVLRSFGERDRIFTSNMIVSDDVHGLDNESATGARQFIERYFRIAGITGDSWENHDEKARRAKAAADYATIFKERRKISQYASRYYFTITIMALSSGYVSYDDIPEDVLDRLARCEHYRYVASMEMAGYRYGPENDELRFINDRMVAWDDLPEERKKYYRMIIQASLTE